MRILKIHRWLGQTPSGENTAVELDVALLRAAGHDVQILDLDAGPHPPLVQDAGGSYDGHCQAARTCRQPKEAHV